MFPCYGFIIMHENKTILCKTDNGYYSFPKGKRNKPETEKQTALRELQEETGILENEIIQTEYFFEEKSDKGFPSVKYFVAKLKELKDFTFDETELESVDWYTLEEALNLDKLKEARKFIIKELIKINI